MSFPHLASRCRPLSVHLSYCKGRHTCTRSYRTIQLVYPSGRRTCQTSLPVMPFFGIRTIYTAASVSLTTSQALLSSRRGQWSSLEDAQHYVASLSVHQQIALRRALQEIDENETEHKDLLAEGMCVNVRSNNIVFACYYAKSVVLIVQLCTHTLLNV